MRKVRINVDYRKLGEMTMNFFRSSSGTVVSGLIMIGLGMLCKKLDIPYEVLTEPNYFSNTSRVVDNKSSIVFIPNNSVEASIAAICDNAKNMSNDFYKNESVSQIIEILEEQPDVTENDKSYAIWCIRSIMSSTRGSFYRNEMNRAILKIGKGDI